MALYLITVMLYLAASSSTSVPLSGIDPGQMNDHIKSA